MVTSVEDTETLVKLVKETALKFLVGQTMRFDPQFVTARRFLENGELGRVIFAEAHYVHDLRAVGDVTPWRVELPQDLVYGGECHPVNVVRWLVGEIGEVFAYANRSGISRYPKEQNFLISLKFVNGTPGRILGAYGLVEPPLPMMGAGLFCTEASLVAEFSDFKGGSVKVSSTGSLRSPPFKPDSNLRPRAHTDMEGRCFVIWSISKSVLSGTSNRRLEWWTELTPLRSAPPPGSQP